MKFTLSWLRDHLDTSAPLTEITDALTRVGLEVERVEDRGGQLAPFVIARVVEARQHPNADRLRVCMVDIGAGGEPVQVVCGAPNARTGMLSVFSGPGTVIPGKGITIQVGTIRGVESRGMLCSAAELGVSEDHEGILDLPQDAPVGAPYAEWAGLDEAVIEIAVTPNRADALGVRGVARDLAAAGLGVLTPDRIQPVRGDFPCPVAVTLGFDEGDRHLCPAFGLRMVHGVRNGPSPDWLQRRLAAIGLRPINALVDITNYLTFDRARPLHVFDADKVRGALTVRRARAGEDLVALDGRTYRLDEETVVIADEAGVESIGGVMGGQASGCDEGTTSVLIESALWDPLNIARTGRRLGVHSDARHRFERGVDPDFARPGLDLATRMVLDLCGGEASEALIAGEIPDSRHAIDFPWTEVKRLTGLDLARAEMKVALDGLGFHISGAGDRVKVAPPSWRADIEGKADLVEEIVRIAGLDRVPSTPFRRDETAAPGGVLTPLQKRVRGARRALAARGLVEAVTWSFVSHGDAALFGGGSPELALANPIAVDLSDMRPSLLPGLVRAAQRNADRGASDLALFEVGQVFASDEPEGQTFVASGLRRGLAGAKGMGRHWQGGAEAGLLDVKADAMALLLALGVPTGGLQVVPGGPGWYHPGRSAMLRFGPREVVGAFGELHPRALRALDSRGPVMAFEITLDALPAQRARPTKARPRLVLADLQPVTRDFAFVLDRAVPAGDVVRAAQGADKALVTNVTVFDVYEGAGIEEGRKSVAIAVTLQPTARTLTDAEIEAVSQRIIADVAKRTGASLRS